MSAFSCVIVCGTFAAIRKPSGVFVGPDRSNRARGSPIKRRVNLHSVEFRRVKGEKIARLHSSGIEIAFPPSRSNALVPIRSTGIAGLYPENGGASI